MNRRINLFTAAVVLGGASLLATPRAAHATYLDPFRRADYGVAYCCRTGDTRCCSSSGCMTREGICLVVN